MSDFFVKLGLGAIVTLPFYLIFRLSFLRRKKGKPSIVREVLLGVFILFTAGLLVLVLWPTTLAAPGINPLALAWQRLHTGEDINLVPLRTIRGFFASGVNTRFIVNIIANVLMFSPLGFCLPLFWRRFQKWWKMLCIGVAVPVGIEGIQLFVGRSVDVDDLLLNTTGIMLGYAVFYLLMHWFRAPLSRLAN